MKALIASACAGLFILSLTCGARAGTFTGTWTARRDDGSQTVHLRTDYRASSATGNEEWSESGDVPLSQLRGVTPADFSSRGEHKRFDIVRDAGTLRADGWFTGGSASGSWTFVPSAAFSSALEQRGVGRPNDKEQFELAITDFKLATLDTLLHAGFERPSAGDLVSMSEHGVNDAYVSEMKNLALRPKSIAALVRMRDHGVSSAYIDGLKRLGFRPSADDLVRLMDHGVTIAFIERMRSHGYTRLSADDLIRLRDHGF